MKKLITNVFAVACFCTASSIQAASYTWTGGADNNWSNTLNWAGGTVPAVNSDNLIYGADSDIGLITIQNGANMPETNNIPAYACAADRTPHFVVEDGAALTVVQGAGYGYGTGPTGVGAIATVGNGASLTMIGNKDLILMRDGDGRQSYNVNGGTLNFIADRVDFGFNNARLTDWNLDAGNVVFTHKTWGLGAKINVFGSRNGGVFDDVNQSKVTLQGGSSFLINGKFAGNMDDDAGFAAVVFDIQDGSSLIFKLDASSAFTSLAEVEAGEGKYWISSIQGDDNLQYAIDGETVTISIDMLPSPDFYAVWLAQYPTLGTSTNYTDDFEPDGMNNLIEYALGGNPTNSDAAAILPMSEVDGDSLNYVYNRRENAAAYGLTYTVLDGTDLVIGGLVNTNTSETVSGVVDGFETVTNSVSMAVDAQQFMQLKIEATN